MLMSRFQPSRKLVPKRPETKLISPSVLVFAFTNLFQALAQVYVYFSVIFEPGHLTPIAVPGQPNTINTENTAIFLFSCFLYIFTAALFCSLEAIQILYVPFYLYVLLQLFSQFLLFFTTIWLRHIIRTCSNFLRDQKSIIMAILMYSLISILTEYFKPTIIRIILKLYRHKFNRSKV